MSLSIRFIAESIKANKIQTNSYKNRVYLFLGTEKTTELFLDFKNDMMDSLDFS
jgi:hypothetical protein